MFSHRILKSAIVILLAACTAFSQTATKTPAAKTSGKPSSSKASSSKPTATHAKSAASVAEAQTFMKKAEDQLLDLGVRASRASWVQENFITDDTEAMSAQANEKLTAVVTQLALDARRFDGLKLPPDLARKFLLLKLSLTAPAPNNDAERKELTELASKLDGMYGKGKYCKPAAGDASSSDTPTGAAPASEKPDAKPKCLSLNDLSRIMASSTNPDELLDAWVGWHKISVPMKDKYARFVQLSNKGASELGFKDTGAMWRSNYDMSPDEFSAEVERLWRQVEPFYVSLHTYVRKQLIKKYGKAAERPDGMIPAHLLGNMWAQEWGNVYPLVAPANGGQGYDLTQLLKDHKVNELGMVHYGENFFKSLGFAPLPETFWERSLFLKPQDREVVCHASAWDVDSKDDLRLKMCIEVKDEDFVTIHHELGHNFYQRAYKDQPPLFEDSANDGFHEAVGDTIALSVTPEYLKEVGLLDTVPPENADIGYLLKQAMDKIAFLPFGLLIDKWRWEVFSGQITPAQYNKAWWDLKAKYQGVAPPVERSEADFDPGAKYHIASNTPYVRYFMARILQFQFHRALCQAAGIQGPLHRCSIYKNKAAGERLNKMLSMGKSKPWPDALEAISGQRQMDATAILDYFAPLKKWLDEQNQGEKPGWQGMDAPTETAPRHTSR
ncbi:MAG TPA: M2 family metallopeptidase [Candidatus Dormibacteraeota bacterium]|nr:M2 family metallopeptidase [Candidatus Dormibacteraeota bacterium]